MNKEEIEHFIEEAKFYILNNRFEEAERLLEKVLKKHPENPDALFYMGLLNELLNRFTEAREFYEKVLSLDPDYHSAEEHLSRLQEK